MENKDRGITKLSFDLPFIGAITVYPWIFISKSSWDGVPASELDATIRHERTHLGQQVLWFQHAWLLGLFAWFICYELFLPFWWNPFRRRWETEAYIKGQGYSLEEIDLILRGAPYWLKW
jgi:hypothetical protein